MKYNIAKIFVMFSFLMIMSCSFSECRHDFINDNTKIKKFPLKSFIGLSKLFVLNEEPIFSSTSSGVIIEQHIKEDYSLILTARHSCRATNERVENIKKITNPQPIFRIYGIDHDYVEANIINISEKYDLCLLKTHSLLKGEAIEIANVKPNYGDEVYNLAAPLGIKGANMGLIFQGFYSGNLLSNLIKEDSAYYSFPIKGGSSGSPVLNKDLELIGIVFSGVEGFESVAISCTYSQLIEFLETYSSNKKIP